jgi:hypothetical protein
LSRLVETKAAAETAIMIRTSDTWQGYLFEAVAPRPSAE